MGDFYSEDELKNFGFRSVGHNVFISRSAKIHAAEKIEIGHDVRIDDFCFLSGYIKLGSYIHISTGCLLYGSTEGITIGDFGCLAPRIVIHADSDDYSGNSLTNPMVDVDFKNLTFAPVTLCRHVIIGTGTVVLPGVVMGEGCSIGALSLVKSSLKPWTINAGIPCREIGKRSKNLLELEQKFLLKQESQKQSTLF